MMQLPHWNCRIGTGLVSIGLGLGACFAGVAWAATASFTVTVQLVPIGCTATGGTTAGTGASVICDAAAAVPVMAMASTSPLAGTFGSVGVVGLPGAAPLTSSPVQMISSGASVAPASFGAEPGRLAVQSYSEARLTAAPAGLGSSGNLAMGQTWLNSASIPMSAQMHQTTTDDSGAGSSPRREVVFVF
jgi:hypothetical protein